MQGTGFRPCYAELSSIAHRFCESVVNSRPRISTRTTQRQHQPRHEPLQEQTNASWLLDGRLLLHDCQIDSPVMSHRPHRGIPPRGQDVEISAARARRLLICSCPGRFSHLRLGFSRINSPLEFEKVQIGLWAFDTLNPSSGEHLSTGFIRDCLGTGI